MNREYHVADEGSAKALYLKLDGLRHAIDMEGEDSIEIGWCIACLQNPGEEAVELAVVVETPSARRLAKYDMDFTIFKKRMDQVKIPANPREAASA